MPGEADCLSIATDRSPVDCLVYRPIYATLSDGRTAVGVCIYLGATVFLNRLARQDFNWLQRINTDFDPHTKDDRFVCPLNTWHPDPCGREAELNGLYRSDEDNEKFKGAAAAQWGVNYVFRDLPNRAPESIPPKGMYWRAELQFVRTRLPFGVTQLEHPIPIEQITYGFTVRHSVLHLDPLVINGVAVSGSPQRLLLGAPDAFRRDDACNPDPSNQPSLHAPPAGYVPPAGTQFLRARPPESSRPPE